MVIVKIAGGLGNQMFMAAYAKILQMRHYQVALDVESFFRYNQNSAVKKRKICMRELALDDFDINIPFLSPSNSIYRYVIGEKKCDFAANVLTKTGFYHYYDWSDGKYTNKYMREMINIKDHSYVYGYFQNEKFFRRYEPEIRKMFTPKRDVKLPAELEQRRNKTYPLVAIHFRRTDYTYAGCVLQMAYYENALSYIEEKIGKFEVCIFTDDCAWIKSNWDLRKRGYQVFYADDYHKERDYEEMLWMAECDHQIIANSSFSWWGAWLNPNKNKIVIAPLKWDYRTWRVPENWVQLNNNFERYDLKTNDPFSA